MHLAANDQPPLDYTELGRSLALAAGRDPSKFDVTLLKDNSLMVKGPGTAAFYPLEAWTSKFLRHLHRGYFDSRTQVHPAAVQAVD